jgi:hypothetical protein
MNTELSMIENIINSDIMKECKDIIPKDVFINELLDYIIQSNNLYDWIDRKKIVQRLFFANTFCN